MAVFSGLTAYYLFLFHYYFGSNLNICNPKRIDLTCTGAANSSCVYYTGPNCTSPIGYCQKEVANYCEACNYTNMIDYRIGSCNDTELYSCLPEDRVRTCNNTTSDPVCGYYLSQSTGEVTWKNHVNGCEACKVSNVGFYTKGECWLELKIIQNPDGTITKVPNVEEFSLPATSENNTYQTMTSTVSWANDTIEDSSLAMKISVGRNGGNKAQVSFTESITVSFEVDTVPNNR